MSTYTKEVARGATFDWTARFYNSDRTAYDLSDKTVKFRVGTAGGTTLLETTATSPSPGVVTGSLSSDDTASLAVGTYDFHIGIFLTAGDVPLHRPITGTLTILPVVGGTL